MDLDLFPDPSIKKQKNFLPISISVMGLLVIFEDLYVIRQKTLTLKDADEKGRTWIRNTKVKFMLRILETIHVGSETGSQQ